MTYALVQDVPGGDWETYSRINDEVGKDPIEGLVLLAAGLHEGGVRVISLWESPQAYRTFVADRLSPASVRVTGSEANGSRSATTALEVRHLLRGKP
jgi:hypothetical protein